MAGHFCAIGNKYLCREVAKLLRTHSYTHTHTTHTPKIRISCYLYVARHAKVEHAHLLVCVRVCIVKVETTINSTSIEHACMRKCEKRECVLTYAAAATNLLGRGGGGGSCTHKVFPFCVSCCWSYGASQVLVWYPVVSHHNPQTHECVFGCVQSVLSHADKFTVTY